MKAPVLDTDLLWKFKFKVKTKILPDGERSHDYVYTYLHYPGQRFTAYYTIKDTFINTFIYKNNSYAMQFEARNIDVITRRNKRYQPCVEDWRQYDQNVMEK